MSAPSTRQPLSIREQADLLDKVLSRTVMHGGDIAKETAMILTKEEAEDLDFLVMRLRRMQTFESEIRRVVTGR